MLVKPLEGLMRIVTANYGPPAEDYHRQYMKIKPFALEQSRLTENIEAFRNRRRREKRRKKMMKPDANQPKISDLFAKVKTEDDNLSLEQIMHDSTDDNKLPESEPEEIKFEDIENKEVVKKLIFVKNEKILKGEAVKREASIKEDVTDDVIDLSLPQTSAMPQVYNDPLSIIGRSSAVVTSAPQPRQSTIIASLNQRTMWPQNVINGPIALHPTFDDNISHPMRSGEQSLMLSNTKVDKLTAEIENLKRIISEQEKVKRESDTKGPQRSESSNEPSESSISAKDQQLAQLTKEVAELKRRIKEKEEADYEDKLQKMISSAIRMAKQDAIRTTMRKMRNKQTLINRFKIKKRRPSSTVVRKDDYDEKSISDNKEYNTTKDTNDVSVDGYINDHTYLNSEVDVKTKAAEPVGDSQITEICSIPEKNNGLHASLKVVETSRANNDNDNDEQDINDVFNEEFFPSSSEIEITKNGAADHILNRQQLTSVEVNDKIEEVLQQDDSSFSVEELLNEKNSLDEESDDEMSGPHSPVFTNTPYFRGNVTATLSNESSANRNLDEQSTLASDDQTYHEIDLDTEQGSTRDNDKTESSMNLAELQSGQGNQTISMGNEGASTPPPTADRQRTKNDDVVVASPLSSTQLKKTDSGHKTPARSRRRIWSMTTPEIYGNQRNSKRKRHSSESGHEDELIDNSQDGQEVAHVSHEMGPNDTEQNSSCEEHGCSKVDKRSKEPNKRSRRNTDSESDSEYSPGSSSASAASSNFSTRPITRAEYFIAASVSEELYENEYFSGELCTLTLVCLVFSL